MAHDRSDTDFANFWLGGEWENTDEGNVARDMNTRHATALQKIFAANGLGDFIHISALPYVSLVTIDKAGILQLRGDATLRNRARGHYHTIWERAEDEAVSHTQQLSPSSLREQEVTAESALAILTEQTGVAWQATANHLNSTPIFTAQFQGNFQAIKRVEDWFDKARLEPNVRIDGTIFTYSAPQQDVIEAIRLAAFMNALGVGKGAGTPSAGRGRNAA